MFHNTDSVYKTIFYMVYSTMTAKERIDELRIESGWTLNRLAEELGMTNTAVYSWYRKDSCNPSIQSIEKACDVFGLSLTEFYSSVDSGDIDVGETLLTESFRKIPKEEQPKVLQIVKLFEKKV